MEWLVLFLLVFGFCFVAYQASLGRTARPKIPRHAGADLKEIAGIFAVPDTTPWWRAIHDVIDRAEMAANRMAQEQAGANLELCNYAAAGAHHLSILRDELNRLREQGTKGTQ